MAAAFDVQLGKCFLQRGLNGGYFLGRVIFFHRRFGSLDGRFGGSNVNFL